MRQHSTISDGPPAIFRRRLLSPSQATDWPAMILVKPDLITSGLESMVGKSLQDGSLAIRSFLGSSSLQQTSLGEGQRQREGGCRMEGKWEKGGEERRGEERRTHRARSVARQGSGRWRRAPGDACLLGRGDGAAVTAQHGGGPCGAEKQEEAEERGRQEHYRWNESRGTQTPATMATRTRIRQGSGSSKQIRTYIPRPEARSRPPSGPEAPPGNM